VVAESVTAHLQVVVQAVVAKVKTVTTAALEQQVREMLVVKVLLAEATVAVVAEVQTQ
jgi:hypothetical protein